MRILLVDDDELLGELLEMTLSIEGYDVVVCTNGADGIERLQHDRYDLVVLDLMMPFMDGLQFMRFLQGIIDPPPVVVLSAAGRGDLARDAIAAGAKAVVAKPVETDELLGTIQRVLTAGAHPQGV